MKKSKVGLLLVLIGFITCSARIEANESLLEHWNNGLAGSRLTAYSGSAISSNSSLSVINICHDNRYNFSREGSWCAQGAACGANSSRISGNWKIRQSGMQFFMTYKTDDGQKGEFLIYLQTNGRVNIGGTAYTLEQGKAGC